jgi:hypothetical protein
MFHTMFLSSTRLNNSKHEQLNILPAIDEHAQTIIITMVGKDGRTHCSPRQRNGCRRPQAAAAASATLGCPVARPPPSGRWCRSKSRRNTAAPRQRRLPPSPLPRRLRHPSRTWCWPTLSSNAAGAEDFDEIIRNPRFGMRKRGWEGRDGFETGALQIETFARADGHNFSLDIYVGRVNDHGRYLPHIGDAYLWLLF